MAPAISVVIQSVLSLQASGRWILVTVVTPHHLIWIRLVVVVAGREVTELLEKTRNTNHGEQDMLLH